MDLDHNGPCQILYKTKGTTFSMHYYGLGGTVRVYTLTVNSDNSRYLVDMHSYFSDICIRICIFELFHLFSLKTFFKRSILSQIKHFVIVDKFDSYEFESKLILSFLFFFFFLSFQVDNDDTFSLNRVDLFQFRLLNFDLIDIFAADLSTWAQTDLTCRFLICVNVSTS